MTPEEYNEAMQRMKDVLRRSRDDQWTPSRYASNDLVPVVKHRPSRKDALTFEQKLTDEDRAFLADLKVGV